MIGPELSSPDNFVRKDCYVQLMGCLTSMFLKF